MWHYKLANSDYIQRAIKNCDCEKAFLIVDGNKKVLLFNETILNIIRNFIPHETQKQPSRDVLRKRCSENMQQIYRHEIAPRHGCSPINLLHIFRTPFPRNNSGWLLLETVTCNDKDPPWMTRLIKKAINDKNLFYQRFVKNKDFTINDSNLERLRLLHYNLTSTAETTKQQYFAKIAKKLCNPNISSKTYRSILKSFLMGKNVPCIPPIFHENRFITDFREKPELFNSFLLISAH